jgi:hypothetical protein
LERKVDLDDIQYLNDAEKDRYVKLERLFTSDGWSLVEEWAKQQRENATGRLINANSWEEHRVMTGVRAVYAEVENLRESTEATFAQIAAANKEAALLSEESKFE